MPMQRMPASAELSERWCGQALGRFGPAAKWSRRARAAAAAAARHARPCDTVFGTANDIALSELALEMLFPADDQTIEITNKLVEEVDAETQPALAAGQC
jgi:hypothetical protein